MAILRAMRRWAAAAARRSAYNVGERAGTMLQQQSSAIWADHSPLPTVGALQRGLGTPPIKFQSYLRRRNPAARDDLGHAVGLPFEVSSPGPCGVPRDERPRGGGRASHAVGRVPAAPQPTAEAHEYARLPTVVCILLSCPLSAPEAASPRARKRSSSMVAVSGRLELPSM